MQIISPLAYGNGAYIVHKSLESNIKGYNVEVYNPYLTLFPPLISLVNSKNVDIVHAPVDYACFSKRKDTPLISTVHGYMLDDEVNNSSGLIRKIHYKTDLKYFVRKSISMSNKVVCVSHYLKNKLIDDLNHKGDIEVIYNGVDIMKFKPVLKDKSTDNIRLLFVGNLRKAKGVDMLPTLLDILGDRYELLYTSGIRNNHYVIEHKNACCVGSIPHDDIPNLYNSADILICPSVREGFGLAIAEAMACGLPVVAANNSAIPELVLENEGGFLCSTGNVREFAEKIDYLADSPKICKEMGEYNRTKVEEKFTLKQMIKNYSSLFKQVLS